MTQTNKNRRRRRRSSSEIAKSLGAIDVVESLPDQPEGPGALEEGERTQPLVDKIRVQHPDAGQTPQSQSGPLIVVPGKGAVAEAAPHDRASLAQWVLDRFGVNVPDRRVCPHHNSPLDYLEASFFGQQDLLVWANRGGGKTYLAAVATVMDALLRGPMKTCVLGGSFDQSDRLADYVRDLLTAYPRNVAAEMTRPRVNLKNGSRIDMLAQSQTAVRGQHVQKIRCDEVDLFDSEIWRAVQFATRSKSGSRGSIEVLSTLHRSGGLMQQLVDQARSTGILPVSECSTGILPVSVASSSCSSASSFVERLQQQQPQQRHGQDARDTHGQDAHATHGQDAHATHGQDGHATHGQDARATNGRATGYRLIQWCLWEVIERCDESRRCEDCPLAPDCRGVAREANGFFSIDDAIAIRARSSRTAWEAEMLCRGVRRDRLVLREFDPARHIGEVAYNRAWPLYRAMDFGFTSPMVCLWLQVTPAGCVHVLSEYLMPRRAISQHAKAILAMDPGKPVTATYVDPAGKQKESTSGVACTELLHSLGIYCTSRQSGISEGLELIRAALDPADGPATLRISPKCRQLIDAFENYHYPPPEAYTDRSRPVKDGPDHAIDALRYFFVNRMHPWGKAEMRYY
jgi:hypothetical protein